MNKLRHAWFIPSPQCVCVWNRGFGFLQGDLIVLCSSITCNNQDMKGKDWPSFTKVVSKLRHGPASGAIRASYGIPLYPTARPHESNGWIVWTTDIGRVDQLAMQSARETGETSQGSFQATRGWNNGNGAHQHTGSTTSYTPKLVKLDFPLFNSGEDPTSWICRAE